VKTAPIAVKTPTKALLPKPEPLHLNEVKWIVVKTDKGNVLALTPAEYEKLSLNIAEIIRYVTEVNSQLDYYRNEP
jgi:DNA topoisomerase VI subunit B